MKLADAVEDTIFFMGLARPKPVFWWGPPGIGKTEVINGMARELKRTIVDWRANLRDPVDARGLPMIDHVKMITQWARPNDLPFEGSDFPDDTIVFMDEANTASAAMQVVQMQLVHEGRVGEHRLKKGVYVLAAGNRTGDRAAAQRMPTALANRFAHIDVEPDVVETCDHFYSKGLNPMVPAFLRWKTELLHNMEGKELRAFPTPRSWEEVCHVPDGPQRMRRVTSLIGEGAAAEYEGFVRVFKNLPSLDYVLSHPTGADLVTEISAKFAITAGLARKVSDDQSFKAARTYIGRFNAREYDVMLGQDVARRDKKLTHTQTFTDWSMANRDVLLPSGR